MPMDSNPHLLHYTCGISLWDILLFIPLSCGRIYSMIILISIFFCCNPVPYSSHHLSRLFAFSSSHIRPF